jgi:hypothetical protein
MAYGYVSLRCGAENLSSKSGNFRSLIQRASTKAALSIAFRIKVSIDTSIMEFKRNQIDEAIFRTLGANEVLRIKRLLVTDRRFGRSKRSHDKAAGGYAFHSQDPPGSGVEIMFSPYEAFAMLAGITLLDHGIPQGAVVSILRQVRPTLEAAHDESLKKDPRVLFDPETLRTIAKPGMMATDNTDPVFLVFIKISEVAGGGGKVKALVSVCRGHYEWTEFVKKHSVPGFAVTTFEFVGLMHRLATNLSNTRPVKRGRSTV